MLGNNIFSQNYVSPEPADKNVILEEFTGVRCPNCPAGHTVAQSIITNNPGRAFAVAYHPYNSSYTEPYPGNPDFRRHFPDALYTTPYCGSSRFMPSAFINRRIWSDGERIQSRSNWVQYSNTIMSESSPVNVGLTSNYNSTTKELNITVEVYYTAHVSDIHSINVILTESGLVAQQAGGSTNYIHKHIFREVFTAQWGDTITEPTTLGSYFTREYIFDNTTTAYDMSNCEIMAFIVNLNNDEDISGVGAEVGRSTIVTPIAGFSADTTEIFNGDSINFTDESICHPTQWEWIFEGGTPETSNLQNPTGIFYYEPGNYSVTLTVTNQSGNNTLLKTEYIYVGGVGINKLISETDIIKIYPNPAIDKIFIETPVTKSKISRIFINNSLGKTIREITSDKLSENPIIIDLSNQPNGLYFISIKSDKDIITKKFSLIK